MSLHLEGLRLELPATLPRPRWGRSTPPADRWFTAIDDLDVRVGAGEAVALVGASASGKSLVALAVLGLAPPGGRLTARRFEFFGQRLDPARPETFRGIRGRVLGYVPQEPRSSLDPLRTVGRQLEEVLARHELRPTRGYAEAALAAAGVTDPKRVLRAYPHELSGGMAQRVALAAALAPSPRIIVADEPTTALDLPLRAEILEGLRRRVDSGVGLLLVTHDLDAVEHLCDRALVLHAGRLVEAGPARTLRADPRHPFTRALWFEGESEPASWGASPDLEALPRGCAHHPLCPQATARCQEARPAPTTWAGRTFACHHPLGHHPQAAP